MKRPNLTKGEWKLREHENSVVIPDSKNHNFIAYGGTIENAKAITQVPNLIDIGIKILHKLQSETESVNAFDMLELEQILLNAGCKDDL